MLTICASCNKPVCTDDSSVVCDVKEEESSEVVSFVLLGEDKEGELDVSLGCNKVEGNKVCNGVLICRL